MSSFLGARLEAVPVATHPVHQAYREGTFVTNPDTVGSGEGVVGLQVQILWVAGNKEYGY